MSTMLFVARLLRLRETGLMNRMEAEAMPRPHSCESSPFVSVTFKDIAPALLLFAIGVIIALFCLAVEVLWNMRSSRYQSMYFKRIK
jgi:hypothetical protein